MQAAATARDLTGAAARRLRHPRRERQRACSGVRAAATRSLFHFPSRLTQQCRRRAAREPQRHVTYAAFNLTASAAADGRVSIAPRPSRRVGDIGERDAAVRKQAEMHGSSSSSRRRLSLARSHSGQYCRQMLQCTHCPQLQQQQQQQRHLACITRPAAACLCWRRGGRLTVSTISNKDLALAAPSNGCCCYCYFAQQVLRLLFLCSKKLMSVLRHVYS
jgi:hypothetical protein